MKIKTHLFLTALALLSSPLALACTEDGKGGFFPVNDLYIPANSFAGGTLSESDFTNSITRAEKIYSPVFATQGRVYKVIPKWTDGTVNAYAKRNGNTSEIYMFGGLARHPKMTGDAFELVICHETGHHLGGAPKVRNLFRMNAWASNEGQADYFATLKCAREMWKSDNNAEIVAKMDIPTVVTEKCQKAFDVTNEIAMCQRSAMAGKALGDTLAEMNRGSETDFEKPDPSVVTKMFDAHPAAQCRLDTYVAGAVCAKSKDLALSDTDPTIGTCAQENGDVLGVRPLCWYVPFDKNNPPSTSSWPSGRLSRR